jgi:protein-disulfide isomerase
MTSEKHEKKEHDEKGHDEKKHEEKKHEEKKSQKTTPNKFIKDLSSNYWSISTIVLAVVLLIFVFTPTSTTQSIGDVIGEEEAGNIVVSFAEAQGLSADLVDVSFENGLYEVTVTIKDQDVPVYLTADGKNLIPSVVPIAEVLDQAAGQGAPAATQQTPPQANVPKSDKPTAELFVMTHCPYGTQAEKGFLPALELLSDDADVKIRFVHYFMHTNQQEDVETPRQVCIREEQADKFIPYLKCFLGGKSGTAAEAVACEKETGVDSAALEECISSGKAAEYYAEDSKLSEEYGVRGSPTLIINGQQAQYGRNAESYKQGICSAFNDAPAACSETLDSANPSPGFGYSASTGSASASAAQCG